MTGADKLTAIDGSEAVIDTMWPSEKDALAIRIIENRKIAKFSPVQPYPTIK